MIKAIFFTLIFVTIAGIGLHSLEIAVGDGISKVDYEESKHNSQAARYISRDLVKRPPVQNDVRKNQKILIDDFELTPVAEYSIAARVLGTERYRFDRESALSPVDFAVGWGDMSKSDVLKYINISQSGRWYRWRYQTSPIQRSAIETQSANMHMIPANDRIEDQLLKISEDDYIYAQGYLVRIKNPKTGWYWNSSTTRNDTGSGSCEVFYVLSIQKI